MSKKYGLILPNKNQKAPPPKADFSKPSVFGSDSDSDNDTPAKATKIGPGANEKRQARKIQEKALEEDPTVFQYDELYDEIESKREEEKKAKSSEVREPKYVKRLLLWAERRKIENERRLERMVQKERELEGEEFKDKESFVTAAYRKKLEEHKLAEEREKREDYLEAIGDVTRQQDLGGFYRHLYEQKLGPKETKTEEPSPATPQQEQPESTSKSKPTKPRVYRKRRSSEEDNSPAQEKQTISAKKAHLQSNLDADSDFSIDSSSSGSEDEAEGSAQSQPNVVKPSSVEVVVKEEPKDDEDVDNNVKSDEQLMKPPSLLGDVKVEDIKKEEVTNDSEEVKVEKKDKKDIWKKRTVGEVFDAALQRYYERKATRAG